MKTIFAQNWAAFVLFGWLAAWLISASNTDYSTAFSDEQIYMALAPLAVIGGFWSWGIARIATSAYRWILAPLTTVMMVLLTQWSFFSF